MSRTHIGVITDSPHSPTVPSLRQALHDRGYLDGINVAVEYRYFNTKYDRLSSLASELVSLNVDVIAALGAEVAKAVKQATTAIPIVFAMVPDAVAAGVVTNLAHPGGNITGFSTFDPERSRMQMRLLKDVLPGLPGVAIIGDQRVAGLWDETETAAREFRLRPRLLKLQAHRLDLPGALDAATKDGADALLALPHPLIGHHAREIARLAADRHLATLFSGAPEIATGQWGGLLAHGATLADAARRVPSYIDQILRGTAPGNLPVIQGASARLIVNQQTARQLGITIPPAVLVRAERVIHCEP